MKSFEIDGRRIGDGCPCYLVAEISANHRQSFSLAMDLICAAKESGADAVKLQTYTPDTITIDCRDEIFMIKKGLWKNVSLYDLYQKAFTPWEWQPKLKEKADDLGISLFSSAFDVTAVRFLEEMNVPAHKVASFELTDIPLIESMARTGKPILISTGMATFQEIEHAVSAVRKTGNEKIALLKCNSSYPAPIEDMNLATIPDMAVKFDVVAGLSDHTVGSDVPIASVVLGARIIEKHFVLSRESSALDADFSLTPDEFRDLAVSIRNAEKAVGQIRYDLTSSEKDSRRYRRSLFAVEHIKKGELLNESNVRSVRPAHGLPPSCLRDILGKSAAVSIQRGTPLAWELIDES